MAVVRCIGERARSHAFHLATTSKGEKHPGNRTMFAFIPSKYVRPGAHIPSLGRRYALVRALRQEIISAAIATAISSGVRAWMLAPSGI